MLVCLCGSVVEKVAHAELLEGKLTIKSRSKTRQDIKVFVFLMHATADKEMAASTLGIKCESSIRFHLQKPCSMTSY